MAAALPPMVAPLRELAQPPPPPSPSPPLPPIPVPAPMLPASPHTGAAAGSPADSDATVAFVPSEHSSGSEPGFPAHDGPSDAAEPQETHTHGQYPSPFTAAQQEYVKQLAVLVEVLQFQLHSAQESLRRIRYSLSDQFGHRLRNNTPPGY